MTVPAVEKLTLENLKDVCGIGCDFAREVNQPGGFHYAAFREHWGPVLSSGVGELFVIRNNEQTVVALLGCAFVPDCFSGWPIACEQFWYVVPEHRSTGIASLLFNAFEAESRARGCKRIVMAHLANEQTERLEALYTKRGYRLAEKTFAKEI